MRQVVLSGTEVSCSCFIFGTGSLFKAVSSAERYLLLKRAVSAGFTHFDTAPYYGFGVAERELGLVMREHPSVTFTTKVGLYSPGGDDQRPTEVFIRKAAGRVFKGLSRPEADFEVRRAQRSLEGSLRRTGREVVDVFALHEPQTDLMNLDEWRRWLGDCVQAGKVRAFGVAGYPSQIAEMLAAAPDLCRVIQAPGNMDGRFQQPAREGLPQITFGYVEKARKRGDLTPVPEILAAALASNPAGAVVVSTTQSDRVEQYSAVRGAS